jgi:hypothetical protein
MLQFRMLLRLCNGIMTALAIARNPAVSLFFSQVTSEVLARDRFRKFALFQASALPRQNRPHPLKFPFVFRD